MEKKSLEEKILERIEKTGFPLELRVTKFFQDEGYYFANNLYYIDQDENKGREVDMRAFHNFEIPTQSETYYVRFCYLIECKRSVDKPWVVFTSPKKEYDKVTFTGLIRGNKTDANWNEYEFEEKIKTFNPFDNFERRGRSYFEPFKDTGGNIYKSLTTAVKATIATRNSPFGSGGANSVIFCFPIVVFDGKLFEAFLFNNEIKLSKTDAVMVSFCYESPKYKEERFVVPIVTETYLKDFLASMDVVLNFFGKLFKENMNWFEK